MTVWIVCIIIFVAFLSVFSKAKGSPNVEDNKSILMGNNSLIQPHENATYYKIMHVQVRGFDYLTEKEQDFIFDKLSEGDHVYLRNEYDNPKDIHALIVMFRGNKLGYVQGNRSKWVHFLLRTDKIGDILVNKIRIGDYGSAFISLAIYYEDEEGFTDTPGYPLEGRRVNVLETELWNAQEGYTDDWYHILHTDELCFRYKDEYKSSNYEEDCKFVDSLFESFVRDYLAGICITKARLAEKINFLIETPMARKVFWKRIDSYMSHHGYEFAKKELYPDT